MLSKTTGLCSRNSTKIPLKVLQYVQKQYLNKHCLEKFKLFDKIEGQQFEFLKIENLLQ
jgi:hypothetical protein